MDPEAIETRLREFLTASAERERIAAAYLFGSVARGTAGIGVLFSEDRSLGRGLRGELDRLSDLLGCPLRMVALNQEDRPELLIRILRESTLLFERDRSKRVRFEVRARNEYWDFEPVLRNYRSKDCLPDPSLEDLLQRKHHPRSRGSR